MGTCISSFKDKLVRSEFKEDSNRDHCKYKGTFMCGSCGYCKYMYTAKKPVLPNRQIFRSKIFSNCKTFGVVYVLICDCGCFYIHNRKSASAKQFWNFRKGPIGTLGVCKLATLICLLDNMWNWCTRAGSPKYNFSDRIHSSPRGGDWKKTLLQMKLRWIQLWEPLSLLDLMRQYVSNPSLKDSLQV